MAKAVSFVLARRLPLGAGALTLALLGGCVVAPIGAYDVGDPVAYPAYSAYPAYPVYGGYPVYGPSPWYWGAPTVSLGFYGRFGGGRGHRHWEGHRGHGDHHWTPGSRPGRGGFNRGSGGYRR